MKSILIVDDEFDLTSNLRAVLEGEGYKVDVCADGREALQRLRSSKPDAMLLDIMMPMMGGLDVLKVMRSMEGLKDVPVILMSGVRPFVKQADFGWQAFIQKPFTLVLLFDTLREHVGEPAEARERVNG